MRWLAAIAFVLSCAPSSNDSVVQDAGLQRDSGTVLILSVADPVAVVVRGTTVTIRVDVMPMGFGPTDTNITFGSLPPGITATQAVWHPGSSNVKLDITAAADAPEAEIPVEIRSWANGSIGGSTTIVLESSDAIGAIDPTFGDAGRVLLPGAFINPLAMARKSDGSLVIAGACTALQVCVQHVDASGALGVFGAYPNVQTAFVATVASDGRAAIAGHEAAGDTVIEFDDAGNAASIGGQLPQVTALAWDGDALFVSASFDVYHLSSSASLHSVSPTFVYSLESLPSGGALAGGVDSLQATVLTSITASSTQITWGSSTQVADHVNVTNTITDANGVTLVGLGNQTVLRVAADGTVTSTWTSKQNWSGSIIAALPGGEPLIAGTTTLSTPRGALQLGIVQRFDAATFGVLGRAVVRLGGDTRIVAALPDPNADFLYITGAIATAKTVSQGYVARIRLK